MGSSLCVQGETLLRSLKRKLKYIKLYLNKGKMEFPWSSLMNRGSNKFSKIGQLRTNFGYIFHEFWSYRQLAMN
jgi:hypothetical protein